MDFVNSLHLRKYDDEVQFYAFDILVSDGEDLRKLPLHLRKNNLARLLARRLDGIFSDFERGGIGLDLFRHACLMGLEGLVSKRRDHPYRAGRSPHWVKVKNRKHPATERVEGFFLIPMKAQDLGGTGQRFARSITKAPIAPLGRLRGHRRF